MSSGKTFTFAVTGEAVPFRFVAFWGPLALPHQLSMALTVVTEESFSTPAVLLPDRSLK